MDVRAETEHIPRLAPRWRTLIGVAGAGNLVVAAFATARPTAVIERWPWELTRLSVLFLAAMLAAVGVAAVWIAATGYQDALPAGFANLAVTFTGLSIWLAVTDVERRAVAATLGAIAAVNVVLAVVTHLRLRAVDARVRDAGGPSPPRLPVLVRSSFALFAVVLLAVGLALLVGADQVMPWSVGPGTAEVLGWIFVGDATYFAYALRWPGADAGRAQLWSFLGYDAVLLVPLAATVPTVAPELRRSLLVYLAVLTYALVLGLWVVLRGSMRRGGRRSPAAAT